MSTQTHWFVETPTYPYHEVVLEDGSGPTYDVADFLEIDAPTRREAISAAVKQWLAERWDNYCRTRVSDRLNPFKGIKAVSVAEAKAATLAGGPPAFAPEFCDSCPSAHALVGGRWVWRDDGDDAGEDWGWFGTCAPVVGLGSPEGTA